MARRRSNPGSGMGGFAVLAGVGIAAYLAYEWLQSNCVTASPSFPSLCSLLPAPAAVATSAAAAPPSTAATATATQPTTQAPATQPTPPPGTPSPSVIAGASTPWQLAIATMKAAAGTNSLNYNQWFWYFQNTTAPVGAPSGFGVPNSVSPQLAALTAQIGGDPTGASNITAEAFAAALETARTQSGISGFGFNRQPGIPASWLTTYGFDGDAYL